MWVEKFNSRKFENNKKDSEKSKLNIEKKESAQQKKSKEKQKAFLDSHKELSDVQKDILSRHFEETNKSLHQLTLSDLQKLSSNVSKNKSYKKNPNISERPLEVKEEITILADNLNSKLEKWDKNPVSNKFYWWVKSLIGGENA